MQVENKESEEIRTTKIIIDELNADVCAIVWGYVLDDENCMDLQTVALQLSDSEHIHPFVRAFTQAERLYWYRLRFLQQLCLQGSWKQAALQNNNLVIDRYEVKNMFCSVVVKRHSIKEFPTLIKWFVDCFRVTKRMVRKTRVLSCLCTDGNLDLAQWVYERFDLRKRDVRGPTFEIFLSACKRGHLQIARWLVDKCEIQTGCNFVYYQYVALQRACEQGHLEMAQWLIQRFDFTDIIENKHSAKIADALQVACETNKLGMVEWMIHQFPFNSVALIDGLHQAMVNNHLQVVKCLVESGVFPCTRQEIFLQDKFDSLIKVSEEAHSQVMHYLVERFGLRREDLHFNSVGFQLFFNAGLNGDLRLMQCLCKHLSLAREDLMLFEKEQKDKKEFSLVCIEEDDEKEAAGSLSISDQFAMFLQELCKLDRLEVLKWLISHFGMTREDLPEGLLVIACDYGSLQLFEWLLVSSPLAPRKRSQILYLFERVLALREFEFVQFMGRQFSISHTEPWLTRFTWLRLLSNRSGDLDPRLLKLFFETITVDGFDSEKLQTQHSVVSPPTTYSKIFLTANHLYSKNKLRRANRKWPWWLLLRLK